MDAHEAQVIWLFDVAADPDPGPVMLDVDELPAMVDEALAAAGLDEVALEGVVVRQGAHHDPGGFDLVGDASALAPRWCCRVAVGPALERIPVRSGARLRAWGLLRCTAAGTLELEATRLEALSPG